MIINKQEIMAFMNKAQKLIDEKELSMRQIYEYTFVQNKHGIAFEYYDFNGKYRAKSYAKVRKTINKYASIIDQELAGVEKHLPIVFKYTNSPEWCELFYAILMAGYKPLLVNAKTSRDGVNNLIKQAKAVAVISDDPFEYSAKKLLVDNIIFEKPSKKFVPVWEDEVIFCSSGTTGDVKMMVFNGENLCYQIASSLEMAETTKDIMYPNKYGKIKILAMIPFHHIFGFVAVFLWYTFYGKTVVFPSSMNSKEIQELCSKHEISHIYSVPLFWDSLALQFNRQKEMAEEPVKGYLESLVKMNLDGTAKLKKIVVKKIQEKLLGSSVRMCISGGGYLSENTARTINGIGYPLYNGFGMTEIGVTSVELSPILRIRLLCAVGKPFHGVTYKFANNENNGELLVKSKAIHSKEIIGGVLKESSLDEEGFFHTGDIAEVDKDGNYFIKGRIKDVIINADGENIFPDELELYFKEIPGIINFSVLGIKKAKKDHKEMVALVAQVANGEKEETDKILEAIKAAGKKLPNGVAIEKVYFTTTPLPTANNMKVKRHVIKEAIEAGSSEYISGDSKVVEKKEVSFDSDTVKNILNPVKKLFAEVLILRESEIKNDSHWINDLGGDSMNYFELITKINEKFGVVIPDEHYTSLACVNDFVEEIQKLKE